MLYIYYNVKKVNNGNGENKKNILLVRFILYLL